MIRAIMAAAVMAAIASCSAPIGDMPLTGLDLNDSRVVRKIARQLPDRERTAFTTYALLHWPDSKNYCGRPIGQSGRVASTVGEAVAQTLRFEADLEATRQASRAGPASRMDSLRERRTLLTDQIEQLVLKRDVLYARLGAEAPASREAKLLGQEMQQLQDQRAAVENQILQAPEAI
jgi:hypothetical protein